jgi:hypothetical protein
MTSSDWNSEEWTEEDDAEILLQIKTDLANALAAGGVNYASATDLENDVYVEGPLSVIVEAIRDWRSEIEELG